MEDARGRSARPAWFRFVKNRHREGERDKNIDRSLPPARPTRSPPPGHMLSLGITLWPLGSTTGSTTEPRQPGQGRVGGVRSPLPRAWRPSVPARAQQTPRLTPRWPGLPR